jgi:hypothetical protein
MPDVVLECDTLHPAEAKSMVLQSELHIGVFTPVAFVSFVKTVDRPEIPPKNGEIASLQVDYLIEFQKLPNERSGSPPDRAVPAFALPEEAIFEEAQGGTIQKSRADTFRRQAFAYFPGEFDATTGSVGTFGAGHPMIVDEVAMGDAITVEKNEKLSAGAPNSFIQKPTLPEASIFLPKVDEGNADTRECLFEGSDEFSRTLAASVVTEKDFEI